MSFTLLGILQSQAAGGAAGSYELLETQVLSSFASSVTFTGLDSYSDYKHLQIRVSAQTDETDTTWPQVMYFNGDNNTGSYNANPFRPFNSNVQSLSRTNDNVMEYIGYYTTDQVGFGADAYGQLVLDILDFSSTNKNTVVRTLNASQGRGSTFGIYFAGGEWQNTSAITSMTFEPYFQSGGYFAGSRWSIYGMRGE